MFTAFRLSDMSVIVQEAFIDENSSQIFLKRREYNETCSRDRGRTWRGRPDNF